MLRKLFFLLAAATMISAQENHLVVVVQTYNNAQYCEKNLETIFSQQHYDGTSYKNWDLILIDNASTDGQFEKIKACVEKHGMQSHCKLIRNEVPINTTQDFYNTVRDIQDDSAVVLWIDGRDWLPEHNLTFAEINDAYQSSEVWITCGRLTHYPALPDTPSEDPALTGGNQLPEAAYTIRHDFFQSHLKTFKVGLFKRIKPESLQINRQWLPALSDVAVMWTLCELAGPNRLLCMNKILYVYNTVARTAPDTSCDILALMSHLRSQKQDTLTSNFFVHTPQRSEQHLVVVTPSYNNADWCERHLESIFAQKRPDGTPYENWDLILIDDASTDGQFEKIKACVAKHGMQNHCKLIRNETNRGSMANIYAAIHAIKDKQAIVICIDGDDWLPDHHLTFENINSVYQNPNIWVTFGQYETYPDKYHGPGIHTPSGSFRNEFYQSHLRTFRAELFKKIKIESLQMDGKWIRINPDVAIMWPVCEMAGPARIKCLETVLYIYNTTWSTGPRCKTKEELDLMTAAYHKEMAFYRSQTPYQRLTKL